MKFFEKKIDFKIFPFNFRRKKKFDRKFFKKGNTFLISRTPPIARKWVPMNRKLFWNLESDLVKVNSKTPFGPPKGAKWGQSGPNPIFCPIIAIFAGKGPFWKF